MPPVGRAHMRLVRAFRETGAVGKDNAKSLDEIGAKVPKFIRSRLFKMPLRIEVARKWIVKVGDKFYLEEKYSKFPIEKLIDKFKKDEE